MTSQIVSSTIDENFPVAGQDNDSQGFRDNFSIIKDGLATASSEITNLQNNTAKLNEANNFSGTLIDNALTNRLYGKVYSATVNSGSVSIDYANGEYQILELARNFTITFINWPDDNNVYAKIRLALIPTTASSYDVLFTTSGGGAVKSQLVSDTLTISGDGSATIVDVWTAGDGSKDVYVSVVGSFESNFSLQSLSDTLISAPSVNQVLIYNGTKWVNGSPSVDIGNIPSLENVGDVDLTDLANGDIIKWNGVKWVPANDPTITSLNDIPDVNINSALEGNILRYSYSTGEWQNERDPNLVQYALYASTNANSNDAFYFNAPPSDSGNTIRITDAAATPFMLMHIGNIYRFDLSHVSNTNNPLRFTQTKPSSLPAETDPTAYADNVRIVGTPGQAGSYVEIEITKNTPETLYMYGLKTVAVPDAKYLGRDVPLIINKKGYYSGSEELVSTATASPIKSVSYFTTAGAETATLNIGYDGQIKTFAMVAANGDMVITVANAGWKASGPGTITFNTLGQACTLQYISDKWFCIGNNGATFS